MDHKELIRQLGTAIPMMGAKNFMAGETSLSFRIGRNSKGVNKLTITLSPDDTYIVRAFKVAKFSATIVGEMRGVYVDSLHAVLESLTGMYTRL